MVALVIGMIGVLVIMQVARTGEAQKRLTAGSGDAQNNGAMSIYSIQRDMKQAGYGFNSLNALGCPLTLPSGSLSLLAPAMINSADVPAGDANTDTLLIVYGSSNGSPEGDTITGKPGADEYGVMSAANFRVGEWAVATPGAPTDGCALIMKKISSFDVPAGTVTIPGLGANETESLFDFGLTPGIMAYAIRDGNLTTCDYMLADCSDTANWQTIANGIISLRAQYGHASTATGGVDLWNQVKPSFTTNQEDFSCQWARISAVRLALVARNSEPDKEVITSSAPVWAGSDDNPIDLSANGNWGRYRYQVYETVMPLRNIPWMGSCT
jgi:type IV pilus assembly protein PilW